MTDQEVLDILCAWDETDLIYRDVARMARGEINLEELLQAWPPDHEVIQYALYPEKRYDIIPSSYLLGDERSVAINKHPRYNVAAWHSHDYFELNYVVKGHCIQHFEDGMVKLSVGDFCLLSPDAIHYISTDDDDSIVLNIGIRQTTFIRQFSSLPRQDSAISSFFMDNLYSKNKLRYLLAPTAGDETIRHIVLQMYAEEMNRDRYTDDILVSVMSILFNVLLRYHSEDMKAPPMRQTQNALTDEMLGYIHKHFADITLEQMAETFHFSRQYCSRLIRELTGESFSELITMVRIGYGETLLMDTFLSLEEISEKVGYANPETFIRAFKRVRGMTPNQFRRKNKQSPARPAQGG